MSGRRNVRRPSASCNRTQRNGNNTADGNWRSRSHSNTARNFQNQNASSDGTRNKAESTQNRSQQRGRGNFQKNDNFVQRHRAEGRPHKTQHMGFKYIESLLNSPLEETMSKLTQHAEFFEFISKPVPPDFLVLIVQLIRKFCECKFSNLLLQILQKFLNPGFINNVQSYISSLPVQTSEGRIRNSCFWNDPDEFWASFIEMCNTVLKLLPRSYAGQLEQLLKVADLNLPMIESKHNIHINDETKEQIKVLIQTVEAIISESEKKGRQAVCRDEEEGDPPDDFREIDVYPTSMELLSDQKPFLRKNVVRGPYRDVDHYLDVQYRLLREDFVGPLREGINSYLRNKGSRLENIKVHKKIRFLQPVAATEHFCVLLQFNFKNKKKGFNYEHSRRFLFGSLVCFTRDNFQTLIFGKVVDRDKKYLENGEVVVGFDTNKELLFNEDYVMVECSVYFEPYYHVLSVMKEIRESEFPMRKYVIDVDVSVELPDYITQDSFYKISDELGEIEWQPYFGEKVQFHNFNPSQNEAFIAALTRKFSVIQGPPGTGKTFVGLKIARTLLENENVWYKRTPLLVVCYTNHALDQFLEGLLPVTENIVRIGGQSKNENLNKFNLRNHSHRMDRNTFEAKMKVKNYLDELKTTTDNLHLMKKYDFIIDFKCFEEVIPNYRKSWLFSASKQDILKWLIPEYQFEEEKTKQKPDLVQEMRKLQIVEATVEEDDFDLLGELDNSALQEDVDDLFDRVVTKKMEAYLNLPELRDKILRNNQLLHQYETDINCGNDSKIFNYYCLRNENQCLIRIFQCAQFYLGQAARGLIEHPQNVDIVSSEYVAREERWNLYFYWLNCYEEFLKTKYERLHRHYRNAFVTFNELKDLHNIKIIRDMKVIGMTTTGAARLHASLQFIRSPIVIVEEAAEVLEAHIITSVTKYCQHLILIGDHQQLKPSTSSYKIEKVYNLGISLFERMILNNVQCFTLNVQHRMKPEISSLIKPAIYPNLQDHESVLNRPAIKGIDKCLYFIHHDHPEDDEDEGSTTKKNKNEVGFLIMLAKYLIHNGYEPEQITILAAYLGQMFEFMKERAKYSELKQVRIAVLDNYQGEECDIILLSLVRNNSEDKIGFLSIENRVCVALSRARNGLYVMGNMDMLCRKSELWCEIKETLVGQDALGSALALRCQNHGKITMVSKEDDFATVAEGGCDQRCNMLLPCGHNCQRLCHVIDVEHKENKCQENCNNTLCTNDPSHVCKKRCYEDCGVCEYPVTRTLICTHEATMACSMDVDSYKCQTLVPVTLPCGHEGHKKPCYMDVNQFRCPSKCDTRLDCGHACIINCHFQNDPDHVNYKCVKDCAKTRLGCTNPELEGHMCPKLCWEECIPCEISVKKARTICPHYFDVPCCIDVDEIKCTKPCVKILPCTHKCKGKCGEPCGLCRVKVEKEIIGCNHKIKLECYQQPTKDLCTGDCPRQLPCGHICKRKCKDACNPLKCQEIVEVNILGKCNHIIKKIPCSLYALYREDNTKVLNLESYCTEPCTALLNCGGDVQHKCSGTCGECAQGRIHKRCGEKCGLALVCNHLCEIPCRETCKPCQRPCSYKCRHSACKKKCGQVCPKCTEKCYRKCEHQQCTKRCGDICSVPPCSEPCQKTLPKCRHPCIGFCGDPCPPLCRICDKEELEEVLFGTEDDEESRFVLLKDCGHVLESTGMDQWLAQDGDEIKFKVCPKCKTTIYTTERYSDFVKLAIEDVGKVKVKQNGTKAELHFKRISLKEKLKDLTFDGNARKYLFKCYQTLSFHQNALLARLKPTSKQGRSQTLDNTALNSIEIKYQLLKNMFEIINNCLATMRAPMPEISIHTQVKFILDNILRQVDDITSTEIDDVQREISRLNRMIQLQAILSTCSSMIINSDLQREIDKVSGVIYSLSRYETTVDAAVKVTLSELNRKLSSLVTLTDAEKKEIVRAAGLSKGHWFKCPNGHPYAIGECGGAMQIGRCYECGAQIGGTDHNLLSTNSLASDFDGATHAAWSNLANLQDYDIGNLRF